MTIKSSFKKKQAKIRMSKLVSKKLTKDELIKRAFGESPTLEQTWLSREHLEEIIKAK